MKRLILIPLVGAGFVAGFLIGVRRARRLLPELLADMTTEELNDLAAEAGVRRKERSTKR